MNIIEKKINELIPYENNPRDNDGAVEYVANSIKEFGFRVPVIIDKDNVVVAGHTRLKAADKLGIDVIPCIVADDLSEEKIKAFRLADNKVAEMAGWDDGKLERELEELAEAFNMCDFGFPLNSDPMTYDCFKPFRLTAYLDGQFTCWCDKNELQYDTELTVKEDVDFFLQNIAKYHKALRVDKYYPVCKGFTNEGGAFDFRTAEVEKEQFRMMQKKWGSKIIRPNKPTAKKNAKIRGFGGAIRINIPIKGV